MRVAEERSITRRGYGKEHGPTFDILCGVAELNRVAATVKDEIKGANAVVALIIRTMGILMRLCGASNFHVDSSRLSFRHSLRQGW